MIALTLPFPPSANTYYRKFRNVMVLSAAGREYRKAVSEIVCEQPKQEGRLAVFVTLNAPTKRRFDVDNRIKSLLDSLQHAGVFDDDEQIDAIAIMRDEIIKGGQCKVVVCQASSKKAKKLIDLCKD